MKINTLADTLQRPGWGGKENIRTIVKQIQQRLESRLPKGAVFSLTALQEYALNHESFWDDRQVGEEQPRHLIIQGATSSGKTLLSEVNIIDALQSEQTAIVLVPLKAMVRERTEQFRQDLNNTDYRVYGSSSDYQENDERLIKGEYDVAVIVYEKFFAMLSQNGCRILDHCRLVVVDELSMLTKEERGPKLEIALEMVRSINKTTRIMCLSTTDCQVTRIQEWLTSGSGTVKASLIASPKRPVGLVESIVLLDGSCWTRRIPGETEPDGPAAEDSACAEKPTKTIPVPGYRSDQSDREKRRQLLKAVMTEVFQENRDAKILIFVPGRDDTSSVARFLKTEAAAFFPRQELDSDFHRALEACDQDEDLSILLNELLPCGIAYHNGGMSTNLRELIEAEFPRESSHLKVVVATETLTIGVNMPFDCMILLDNVVPRSGNTRQPLTNQEYRNFIGRAGRLGQSNRPGISYLFVPTRRDRDKYWSTAKYEIISANTNAETQEQVPYYLSLLAHQHPQTATKGTAFQDEEEKIQNLYNASFSKICGGAPVEKQELLDLLYENMLLDRRTRHTLRGNKTCLYSLTPFGIQMAPYALSVDTCANIYRYFVAEPSAEYPEGEMPCGLSTKDIDADRYLLDFLYRILLHEELKRSSALSYAPGKNSSGTAASAKLAVLNALDRILNDKDPDTGEVKYALWPNSELELLRSNTVLGDEAIKLQAAHRAVLLFHWTQGRLMREIKELTGLERYTKKIINGDFERIAEMVSFHLEAVVSALGSSTRTGEDGRSGVFSDSNAFKSLYALSTRIKYGMPRDLVLLANKHVHGLDRSRLIALGKKIPEGMTAQECIYTMDLSDSGIMTREQQRLLRRRLELRNTTESFDTWLDILQKDWGGSFSEMARGGLSGCFFWQDDGCDVLYRNLRDAVSGYKCCDFLNLERDSEGAGICLIRFTISIDNSLRIFHLGVLSKEASKAERARLRSFLLDRQDADACILLVSPGRAEKEYLQDMSVDAVMTSEFFALLLADAIRLQEHSGMLALTAFLRDAAGVFQKEAFTQLSLTNYLPVRPPKKAPRFRVLCSERCHRISALDRLDILDNLGQIGPYEKISWNMDSTNLDDLASSPVIMLLERKQIERSKGLTKLLYRLVQNEQAGRHTALQVHCSEESKRIWSDETAIQDLREQEWNGQNGRIKNVLAVSVADAERAIRRFVEDWWDPRYVIGVSYAHYDAAHHPAQHSEEENELCKSDVSKLEALMKEVRLQFEESEIFFDQYYPAHYTFYGTDSKKKSLEQYRRCRLFLVLYNYWTANNNNCRDELKVIQEVCDSGAGDCIYLRCSGHINPPLPRSGRDYAVGLDTPAEELVRILQQKLRELDKRTE